jgi:hypothetical protein
MILRASSSIKPLPNTDHKLLRFYQGEKVHPAGYVISDVWHFSYEKLEKVHDYIQWIFPTTTPSAHVYDIPILGVEEVAAFHSDQVLREGVLKSFDLMLDFYGFRRVEGVISPGPNFEERDRWLFPRDHNLARVSRILESLVVLGFKGEAEMFLDALVGLPHKYRWYVVDSLPYWKKAVGRVTR